MARAKAKKDGPPRRRKNVDVRGREHLEEHEVRDLRAAAAAQGRNGHRDATMIWMAYRHGLRASEVCRLRWDRVDFGKEEIYIARCKDSESGLHTLEPDEIKAMSKLAPDKADRKGWVFRTEGPGAGHVSESGFRKIVTRAAEAAGMEDLVIHPHMLRHACGYVMNRKGLSTRTIQSWLGHKSIQNTVRYTKLDADHFKRERIWKEDRS